MTSKWQNWDLTMMELAYFSWSEELDIVLCNVTDVYNLRK